MKQLLILNYHRILDDGDVEEKNNYTIRLNQFQSQLDLIEELKIPVISLKTWIENKGSNPLSIAFTFDDGDSSVYKLVYPELKKRSFSAAIFPTVSKIGTHGFVSWEELKEINLNGFEIGSHGLNHRRLTNLSGKQRNIEILKSKEQLEKKLSGSIMFFALPYGTYSSKPVNTIRESGYQAVLNTESRLNHVSGSFLLHRFNVKTEMNAEDFRSLIKLEPTILNRLRRRSRIAFIMNRTKSILNRINL